MRLLAAALLLWGCGHGAPPSGYADLHASPLHRLVDKDVAAPMAISGPSLRLANARTVVLSLGQASFPMDGSALVQPEDVPKMVRRAMANFRRGSGAGDARLVAALEGGSLVSPDPALLARLFAAGVRIVGFGHTRHDRYVAPASAPAIPGPSPVDDHSVLTAAGARLVTLLRDGGFIVDLAHLGRAAFERTVGVLGPKVPLLVSHTGARALCDHPRNLSDRQARQVAASGGIVGVVFHGPWLRCDRRPATVADLVRHIEHLVKVMGPTHVALGTDWDGRIQPPKGLEGPAQLGRLERALLGRGMAASTVRGVLYHNATRWLAVQVGR